MARLRHSTPTATPASRSLAPPRTPIIGRQPIPRSRFRRSTPLFSIARPLRRSNSPGFTRCAPLVREAVYLGSRFTLRMVEDNPREDRRTLYIREIAPRELHIFSGKVVSAVKAARLVCERIERGE